MQVDEYDVFISHASEDKESFVRPMAEELRKKGLRVWYDEFTLKLGDSLSRSIDIGLGRSRFGVVVLSQSFFQKNWTQTELNALMTREVGSGTKVILPIWHGVTAEDIRQYSSVLGDKLAVSSSLGLGNVVEQIMDAVMPVKSVIPVTVEGIGSVPAWDHAWVQLQRSVAEKGLEAKGFSGFMEVRLGLQDYKTTKNQVELLDAARRAEVHTFGWPIGVTLENREEFRPRPRVDGIYAEISSESYDYWAINRHGDFYTLISLFEDKRVPGSIFFDTRIVRITEAVMYAYRLYSSLGIPPTAYVQLGVRHGGLKGRVLRSAGERHLRDGRTTTENEVETVVTVPLEDLEKDIVRVVKELSSSLFVIFDFLVLQDDVYQDIVTNYVNGKVT